MATPAASTLPSAGSARLTATPSAAAARPAAPPASAARPVPRTASGPRIRRAASTSGTATTVWPRELPRASAATTNRGGATVARTASAAITTSQLPATATAATLSWPRAIITRDMFGNRATASSAATPSVVPTDRMSSAVIGSLDSGRSRSAGAKARYAEMTTRLDTAGPRAGPTNLR